MAETEFLETLKRVREKYSSNGQNVAPSPLEIHLIDTGDAIPKWWSTARDKRLYELVLGSNHLSGLAYTALTKLANIPLEFVPKDPTITSHVDRAYMWSRIVRGVSEIGEGLRITMKRFILDYLVTDNGGFMEVMGDGPADGPIMGAPWGLRHLDSLRCRRTGDPEYPVVFVDPANKGADKRYKLYSSRVIYMSQMPMAMTRKHGVGFGSVSRSHMLGEVLNGQLIYKLEKMGRRPSTKLFVGDGIPAEKMLASFMAANQMMDQLGLESFGMNVYIGGNGVSVDAQDLNNFDPFDEETGTLMAMYASAFAWGLKIQDIWPVQGSRSSDQISNMQSRGRLPIDFVNDLKEQMESKFCPPYIEAQFLEQDDEQEMMQANIADIRSRSVSRTAENDILDTAAQRRIMLANGELGRAEFVRQQLADGMMEDGSPVATLFYSDDSIVKPLLELPNVSDPLYFEENDPVAVIAAIHIKMSDCYMVMSEKSVARKRRAMEAFAALDWLRGQYQHMIMEATEAEEAEAEAEAEEELNGEEPEETPVGE